MALRDCCVEAGNIEHKKKRRNQRTLRGTDGDRAKDLEGALEDESALAFGEERLNSHNEVSGVPPFSKDISQLVGTNIVKATLDIQEKSRYFQGSSLEQAYFMGDRSNSVKPTKTSQEPTLIGV